MRISQMTGHGVCFVLLLSQNPIAADALSVAPKGKAAVSATKSSLAPLELEKLHKAKADLRREMTALGSSPQDLVCKSDSECSSLEVGVKPCGGPWTYQVFSKRNRKLAVLKRKAAEYNATETKLNEAEQLMSDCSHVARPDPRCIGKVCVDNAAKKLSNIPQ